MRVLVACEESQAVTIHFREKGHEAYSCDISYPSGGHEEWHIQGDAIPIIKGKSFYTMDNQLHHGGGWNMIIGFPPCTYLTNAGAARLFRDKHDGDFQMINVDRLMKGIKARDFFLSILEADCNHIAVENPVPSSIYCMPEPTQMIEPYWFGHPYSKRTCLWLKNLPKLRPTKIVEPMISWVSGGSKKADGSPRENMGMTFRDSERKSKTFDGIARAMADQWSDIVGYRDDEQLELF